MKILNIEMHLFFCTLTILIRWAICKSGLIQEIIPWNERSKDVMPSTRSIQSDSNVLAINYIDDFDSVVKQHQGYIQKVRGFFKAPEAGEYKFYSSCSAPCQIFIGQDDKVKPKQIITQKEESLHNEFNRYPDQVSHTIYLEKDKLYFIEGIEKQHGGLGHLSVGVVLPNDKKILPISKSYLRSNGIGQANRKGEILRGNGKELTRQRDKMFTKLKEINEYIRKLTDAVKRNPVVPEVKDTEISTDTKTTRNKNHKSGKDKGTDIVGEKQKDEEDEMKQNEHMKDISNSMGHTTRRKNGGQGGEKDVTEERFDTKEIGKMEKTEVTDKTDGKISKERTGINIEKDEEQRGIDVQGIQGKRKKDQDFNERKGDGQKPNKNETLITDRDSKLNKPAKKEEEQKAESGKKLEQNLDINLSNGKRIFDTSQIMDNLNRNTEAALKPNDDFMVEHNYIKVSRSRDHSDSLQSNNLHENDDGSDEGEIIQLTNYAKGEIAKHGDLSETAIKNIIRIIKRKLINEGFIKPLNRSVVSTTTSEDVNSTKNAGNKTTQSKQEIKGDTAESKQIVSDKLGKGRILLYDKVVSNLVNAIKESSHAQEYSNQQGSTSDRNTTEDRLVEKSEMINAEKEQRKRMLSSLYLLSSEIESFKQFLGETQNKDKLEKQKLEKQESGKLKDEAGNKQTTLPSIENMRYESNAKKYNTKFNGIMNNFAGDGEEKRNKNENEVERINQMKGKYTSYENTVDRNKASSLALYKALNDNEEIEPGANVLNLSTDGETARNAGPDGKRSRNITPNINFEDGDGANVENFRYTKESTAKHALRKPVLAEGYESFMARITGQNINKREKQNSNEGRNDILHIESAQGPEALIAANASKRNSYTDTLAKTVEQYLTGVTVPALLGEKTSSIQRIDQMSNYRATDVHDLKSDTKGKMEDYKASQRYRIPVKNVMGDKKTHIMKSLKKKDLKRRLDARVKKKGK